MKNFAFAAIILGFIATSASAETIKIDGPKAEKLMKDVEAIGVQPIVIPGSHRFKVIDLQCSYGAPTIDGPLSECSLKQMISGVGVRPIDAKGPLAFQLIQDFNDIGIPGTSPEEGITQYSISQIKCTQMVTSRPVYMNYSCLIEMTDSHS